MKKTILILVWAVVILGGVSAYLYQKTNSTMSHVKIGVIDILSGENVAVGTNFKKGIELARDEYITQHPGVKVDLIFEDDGYDGAKGLAAYKKLVGTDRVNALIVASTPSVNSIAPLAAKESIPVIIYGAQKVDEAKDSIFHIYPNPIFADIALGFAMKSINASTTQSVTGVYTYDESIVALYNGFLQGADADLTDFILSPGMETKSSDLQAIAQKVLSRKPQFIFMSNYAALGAQFIKEFQKISSGKAQPTFVFDLTFNKSLGEYEKVLGSLKSLDGSMVVSPKAVDSAPFTQAYKAKYNETPGELADYGYDSLNLLLATKSSKQNEWLQNIEKIKMTGATGEFNFDSIGRRIPTFTITNLKDGKIPQ